MARLWDFDTVNIPGREMDPLVCKVKVQKLMSQHLAGRNGQNEAQAQVEPPAEVLVSQMTNMGFSREDSIEALQRSGNNVNAAVERLAPIHVIRNFPAVLGFCDHIS